MDLIAALLSKHKPLVLNVHTKELRCIDDPNFIDMLCQLINFARAGSEAHGIVSISIGMLYTKSIENDCQQFINKLQTHDGEMEVLVITVNEKIVKITISAK